MKYCIDHSERAYTEKEFEKVETCDYSGVYQGIDDGKIRVYCFKSLDKVICPKEQEVLHEM